MVERCRDGSVQKEGYPRFDACLGKEYQGAKIQHRTTTKRKHDKLDDDEERDLIL